MSWGSHLSSCIVSRLRNRLKREILGSETLYSSKAESLLAVMTYGVSFRQLTLCL